MKNIKTKAFTLIELMVVVSIVAVMSSISLVALNSAREKARIASLLQFDANIYRALGDKLIAAYEFSDSANLAKDNSTNGKDGIIEGAQANNPTSVNGINGLAASFNYGKYIRVNSLTNLIYPEGYTVTMFIFPISGDANVAGQAGHFVYHGSEFGIAGLSTIWSNEGTCPADNSSRRYLPSTNYLKLNQWNHVAISYKNNNVKYYINGKFLQDYSLPNGLNNCTSALFIGGVDTNWLSRGIVDDVRIYARGIQ